MPIAHLLAKRLPEPKNVTMPKKLLVTLLLSLPFAACSESGRSLVVADGPAAPINKPDTRVIEPTPGGPGGGENNGQPGNTGSSLPSTNTGTTQPGGGGGGSGGGGTGGGGGGPGGQGGSQGGSPVPEPGTLLLFGSGLAGLAGFSLRRRRREK